MSIGAPVSLNRSGATITPRAAGSWLAFWALAFYGTLRWATMLGASEQGRLFASLLLALLVAGLVRALTRTRRLRWGVVPVVTAAALGLLGIAGFPLSTHVGRIASALSDGVGTFGDLFVPYDGGDPNVAAALVLAGGLLLLGAGIAFGSVTRRPGTARLALAAAPLLALAVVPSTIVAPRLPYLHGLVSFVLVALLVFSPRLVPEARGSAIALLGLAAVLGAVGAGVIAGGRLWVNHDTSGGNGSGNGTGGVASAERFNWKQTYGTLGWPYTGAGVLQITARRPAHWKAEDLDRFDGRGWTQGGAGDDDPGLAGVSAARRALYSETLEVNVDQIASDQVISAGYAERPDLPGATPGSDPGTWIAGLPLSPGDDYSVRVYAPDPPAGQLAAAGSAYPTTLARFDSLDLPGDRYADVEALARRLHAGTDSPYAYVEAVLGYLQHGYVYTLDPPQGGTYPLIDFLLHSHRGYCQQFAGAMALLLRMEGVPTRVAVGFSPGQRRAGSHTYVVTDSDAHAWVEVWFPGFGWVTFDPTPGAATVAGTTPAAGAIPILPTAAAQTATTVQSTTAPSRSPAQSSRLRGGPDAGAGNALSATHSSSGRTLAIIALSLLGGFVLVLLAVILRGFWHAPSTAELTAELERAFAVAGQPLDADVTLADLERLLADSPSAAGYVGALSAARYGPDPGGPSAQGRAALRGWLARGGGAGGRLRALRALPPRRRPSGA